MQLITQLVVNELLLQKAHTLDTFGIVALQGFYSYLKIDDAYIHDLYNLLETSLALAKPDYFSSSKSAGAHITISYAEENTQLASDIGAVHYFSIKNLYYAIIDDKRYFVLLVSSPSLQQLRQKYRLPERPYYKGIPVEFHITIAKCL
jgi:hypothetical protein